MLTDNLTRSGFAVATAIALLVVFHLAQRAFSRQHTLTRDVRGRNDAWLLVHAGHVVAALLLVPGIVREALTHDTLASAAAWALAFVALGVVLIQLVGALGVRLLMGGRMTAELDRGNVAAGIAGGANYAAIGLLAAPAVAGSDLHGLGLSVAFFGLAVASQSVYVALFRTLTAYDDSEQIRGDNVAAAISYAGVSMAVAVVLARALTGGDFEGWGPALRGYAGVALLALALYPLRQVVVQGLILRQAPTVRGGALDEAIGVHRDAGMAVMEALSYLAAAIALAELV